MSALAGLAVGDKITCGVRFSRAVEIFTVERLTEATAVCGRATFKLKYGLMVGTGGGAGWDRRYGRIATDADLMKNRIQKAQTRLASVKVDESNLAAIEHMLASIVPQYAPP